MAALRMLSLEPAPREWVLWVLWGGGGYGGSCGCWQSFAGRFVRRRPAHYGKGSGVAAVCPAAVCRQPGEGGGCCHPPLLPQKDAESLLQRLLLLLNFPVFLISRSETDRGCSDSAFPLA